MNSYPYNEEFEAAFNRCEKNFPISPNKDTELIWNTAMAHKIDFYKEFGGVIKKAYIFVYNNTVWQILKEEVRFFANPEIVDEEMTHFIISKVRKVAQVTYKWEIMYK